MNPINDQQNCSDGTKSTKTAIEVPCAEPLASNDSQLPEVVVRSIESTDTSSHEPTWVNATGQWHVIHTKPRQEKLLSEALEVKSIPHFLPLVQQKRVYGHRKRVVELPLFSSYLFLRGSAEATMTAYETRRVVQVLPVLDQESISHELQQIELALRGNGTLDPYPFFEKGRPVRVKSGPFRGLEGIVDTRKGQDRIILVVQTIGQATSLEIDANLLEPLD